MLGYLTINLLDILAAEGEKITLENLRRFACPYNGDVEDFLHNKAIVFSDQGISSVWLVFASFRDEWVLVGYFAIANKNFHVKTGRLSKTLSKRISKFATRDSDLKSYIIAAPLIGQLGKNYRDGLNQLITGDELLQIACNKVMEGQRIFGGRFVFVECEDTPSLVKFYERNQFKIFDRRETTSDEKVAFKGKSLVQLLRFLR